jgi:hypothetical protein
MELNAALAAASMEKSEARSASHDAALATLAAYNSILPASPA